MEQQQFELSDIIIDSVGLVSSAAVSNDGQEVGTNFILLKSRGNNMTDEITIEEVAKDQLPDAMPETWVEKLKSIFVTKADKPEKADNKSKAKAKPSGGKPPMMGEEDDTEEDDEEEEMSMSKSDQPIVNTSQVPNQLAIHEIVKEEVGLIRNQYQDMFHEIEKANKTLQEDLAKAQSEIEALRQDRDLQKSERQRREFIEKASKLQMLPLGIEEKSSLLLKAANALEDDDYKKLESLLVTVDRQLAKTNILYSEIGTSRTPEQVTIEDKIAKSDNPAEALLSLSEDDQAELLKSWDIQAMGGK